MKDERNVRHRRTAGVRWQPVAILLAAVLMVLSVPLGLRSAHAIDLNQNCSLTVNPGNAMLAEDLAKANVVIDLYRVADAAPVTGYDTYDWKMTEPFTSLEVDKEIDNAGWKKLAQQAADIVLGTGDGKKQWEPSATTAAIDESLKYLDKDPNQPIEELPAGLYLIIARGRDVKEYVEPVTDEEAGTSGTVTVAKSSTNKYSFSPELISLPTKEEDEITHTANTANGDWVYDPEVTLKPSQVVNVGPLVITKNLVDYAQREKTTREEDSIIKDPATFVFEVTVYDSKEAYDAENTDAIIYHDYISIVFDYYGSKSVQIDNLPVGSYAVVKEEYSGRVYTRVEEPECATIVAEGDEGYPATAEFTNTNTGKENGSGSVTNSFGYTENDGWVLKQVEDDTAESLEDPIKVFENQ